MLTVVLVATFLTLMIVQFIIQRKKKLSQLQDIGIPVDPPSLLMGNLTEAFKTGLAPKLMEWRQKYGSNFGYYEGTIPIIVTSDPELLYRVFIKEFKKFHGRKLFAMNERNSSQLDMFQAAGERWKRLRTIINPTFSGKQMKAMSPLISQTLEHFLNIIKKHADEGKAFDISQVLGRLSLDIIGCCAFGIDINSLEDPDEPFFYRAQEAFSLGERSKLSWLRFIIPISFIAKKPAIILFKILVKLLPSTRGWFYAAAEKVIEERQASPTDRVDFIQLMLNAHESMTVNEAELCATLEDDEGIDFEDSRRKDLSRSQVQNQTREDKPVAKTKLSMTRDEIKSQCMLFLLAGYETTHTAMSLLCYQLVLNPDIQTKLQQEIDQYFTDEDEPDYTTVKQLSYMEMVIKETLRFYPIAQIALTRECFEEYRYKDLVIKPGMCIQAHIEALHRLPELWGPEDPDLFIPERFAPDRKRHPAAWLGFGIGPRNCIGMRFALMEMKMTTVKLLKRFTLHRCDETKVPLLMKKNIIIGPAEEVFVIVKPREK